LAYKNKQTGSAIVVALFIVALVVIAATAMLTRMQQDIRRTELLLNATQASLYAQGSIDWAVDQQINDWKLQQQQQIIDKTPIQAPLKKMSNATIEATIYDAQGLFNVNNLTDTSYRDVFLRLIKILVPKISNNDAQTITQGISTWIATGNTTNQFDEYYSKQTPPYHSPHRLMTSISEMRLIKGMSPALYSALLPYMIALPATTTININNTTAPVLMSLSPTLTIIGAKSLAQMTQQTPFATTQHFLANDIVKNNPFPENKITTISNYFLVKTQVNIGDQHIILYTLMQRDVKNSQAIVTILWQSKGTL
jgi:general secretion pathway protein K